MRFVAVALLCSGCLDQAWQEYCREHGQCAGDVDAGCVPHREDGGHWDGGLGSHLDCPLPACVALQGTGRGSGSYWVDVRRDGGDALKLYCDMDTDKGGWTLVASLGGPSFTQNLLIAELNVRDLSFANPGLPVASYASVDAVALAMTSTEIRLSKTVRDSKWIRWPLPLHRSRATLWRRSIGYTAVAEAASRDTEAVIAVNHTGRTDTCYQNATGIAWLARQGGAYPATAASAQGEFIAGDNCVTIGNLEPGKSADGFWQDDGSDGGVGAGGFDAPTYLHGLPDGGSEEDWPNHDIGYNPFLMIWLR